LSSVVVLVAALVAALSSAKKYIFGANVAILSTSFFEAIRWFYFA